MISPILKMWKVSLREAKEGTKGMMLSVCKPGVMQATVPQDVFVRYLEQCLARGEGEVDIACIPFISHTTP